jgi:hypothetical protein
LPTGFLDDFVGSVEQFLNNLEPGASKPLSIDEAFGLTGITITQKDQLPSQLTPADAHNSKDKDGNSQPDIRNKSLLGRVSVLAQRANEHKFFSSAVVDTGKTEYHPGASGPRMNTLHVMTRADIPQSIVTQLSVQHMQMPEISQPMIRISERRPDVMLFTTSNQVMSGDLTGSPGTVIVGTHGTAVSASSDGVILHTGAVVADSGDEPASIITKSGKVTIGSDTTAAVISSADNGVRVVAVAGKNERDAKVTFKANGGQEQTFELKPGQELIVADRGVDLIAKTNSSSSTFVASELAGMMPRPSIRLSGARSDYLRMVQRLQSALQTHAGAQPIQLFGAATASSLVPTRVVGSDGSLIHEISSGVFNVEHGSIFTASLTPLEIRTELATIKTKAKAQVSVDVNPGSVRVRACSGPGHLEVSAAGKKIILNPGEEILIADERPTKSDALGSDGLGRRQLSVERLSETLWAVTGDFSIASMLNGANYIMPIRQANDDSSKRIVGDLMKMHASLEYATGPRGRYFAQPKETAQVPDWVFKNGGGGA